MKEIDLRDLRSTDAIGKHDHVRIDAELGDGRHVIATVLHEDGKTEPIVMARHRSGGEGTVPLEQCANAVASGHSEVMHVRQAGNNKPAMCNSQEFVANWDDAFPEGAARAAARRRIKLEEEAREAATAAGKVGPN